MKMITIKPTRQHEEFRQKVIKMLREDFGNEDSAVTFAITAQLLGQILAMQDQRFTLEQWLDFMMENVIEGNRTVVAKLNGDGPEAVN